MNVSDPFLKNFFKNIHTSLRPVEFLEPKRIKKTAEKILKEFDGEPEPPDPQLLEFLTDRIKSKENPNINKKEMKLMPWTLFHGQPPRLIEIPIKLNYFFQIINNPFKLRYLKDLVYVYLANYDLKIKGCELIRKFIWDKLDEHKNDKRSNRRISFWLENRNPLFLPNGHNQTATQLLKKEGEINSLLKELGLNNGLENSKFVKSVSFSMIELTKNKFNQQNLSKCLSINELPDNQLKSRFKDLINKMASEFIGTAWDAEQEIKDTLRSYFLRHLKDPRIPGNDYNWLGVADSAKKVFSQWLSGKDLEFFFNIVDETSADTNWEYRRKFWEAYLPYIENTWVILGRDAKSKLRKTGSKNLNFEANRYGLLATGLSRHSVFLIEMAGFVFIEWNDSGACRVIKVDRCPFKFYEDSYDTDELKVKNPEHKVIHSYAENYGWQERLRQWIRDKTNIFIEPEKYKLNN
jgi:hypothetical protein